MPGTVDGQRDQPSDAPDEECRRQVDQRTVARDVARTTAARHRNRKYKAAKNRSSPAIVGFTATLPKFARGPTAKWASEWGPRRCRTACSSVSRLPNVVYYAL
jgi:hypothetical protein